MDLGFSRVVPEGAIAKLQSLTERSVVTLYNTVTHNAARRFQVVYTQWCV